MHEETKRPAVSLIGWGFDNIATIILAENGDSATKLPRGNDTLLPFKTIKGTEFFECRESQPENIFILVKVLQIPKKKLESII